MYVTYSHTSYLRTVNVVLAVGLPVGLALLVFVGLPTCLVCVIRCYMASKKNRSLAGTQPVATAHTTSAAAPVTQPVRQHYPAEYKAGSQEAPPPYPGHGYPPPLQ